MRNFFGLNHFHLDLRCHQGLLENYTLTNVLLCSYLNTAPVCFAGCVAHTCIPSTQEAEAGKSQSSVSYRPVCASQARVWLQTDKRNTTHRDETSGGGDQANFPLNLRSLLSLLLQRTALLMHIYLRPPPPASQQANRAGAVPCTCKGNVCSHLFLASVHWSP